MVDGSLPSAEARRLAGAEPDEGTAVTVMVVPTGMLVVANCFKLASPVVAPKYTPEVY